MDLRGRNLLKEIDFTRAEFLSLIDLAGRPRAGERAGHGGGGAGGRDNAPIFQVAAHDEGAHVTYLGPEESQLGYKESMKDTARVLGRMFDGIEYRGSAQESIEILGQFAGVPVWNGLTDQWHPTQMLADMLTMRDHAAGSLPDVSFCYLGDGRNNTANSLLVTGALLGMDARICAPAALQPSSQVQGI